MRAGIIFLVGMMGAGKTTVGKALARRLGLPFFDSDLEIMARSGVPIATIFEVEGEAGFRRRERAMLTELSACREAVVATGGGAVLDPENRRLMRASGTVVYLDVGLDYLCRRTARDASRPLLAQSADRRKTLAELLAVRDPLYRDAAHHVIDGGATSASALANRIAEALAKADRTRAASDAEP